MRKIFLFQVIGRFRHVFTEGREVDLVVHILEMEEKFYGLITRVCVLLPINWLKRMISNTISIARSVWQVKIGWKAFERDIHSSFSEFIKQLLQSGHKRSFNKANVRKTFIHLEELMNTHHFGKHIFLC